jgi:hypothetical protein
MEEWDGGKFGDGGFGEYAGAVGATRGRLENKDECEGRLTR